MGNVVGESPVEKFIREKGVTRCPRAYLLPTQAQISKEEQKQLRDHEPEVRLRSSQAIAAQRKSGERGAESRRRISREFFEGLREMLTTIIASGTTLDRDIAAEFNQREIASFQKREWTADTVYNMRKNLEL